MPKTKSNKKRSRPVPTTNFSLVLLARVNSLTTNRKFYLLILGLGLLLLFFYKKSWFVAATVNGSPISNFSLQERLNAQYRQQTLSQLIDEKIITSEARKKAIAVTEADIDNKVAKLEENFGGAANLDNLLLQQGQSRQSLKEQLKIQLSIEKLYQNEATSSPEEIAKFIEDNKDQLKATDSAKQQEEARGLLRQQKLSKIFAQKFQELKAASQIKIF